MPGSVFGRRFAVLFLLLFAFLSPVTSSQASAQGADVLTCDDFTNQEAAQIVLDLDDSYEDTLDEDGDGEACSDLPSREGDEGSEDELKLNIGLAREVFEEQSGEPADDAGSDNFAIGEVYEDVGDYPTVAIYWERGFAAHIRVELPEELDEKEAWGQSFDLFTGSINLFKTGTELDDGALLYKGGLPGLGNLFDQDVYDEHEVGGEPGDVRVILIPGDEEFAYIDVAIGLGEEYDGETGSQGGSSKGQSGADDPDADAYLSTVRDGVDQMAQDIEDYSTLLNKAADWTDADVEQMADILKRWGALENDVAALDAPAGYEEIQQTYEDAATALTVTAADFTKFVTDSDEDALADSFISLAEASSLVDELDQMLADEGV